MYGLFLTAAKYHRMGAFKNVALFWQDPVGYEKTFEVFSPGRWPQNFEIHFIDTQNRKIIRGQVIPYVEYLFKNVVKNVFS
jgi:hypothetical protein